MYNLFAGQSELFIAVGSPFILVLVEGLIAWKPLRKVYEMLFVQYLEDKAPTVILMEGRGN